MENEIIKKRLREKTNSEICKENNINTPILTNIVDEVVTKNKIRTVLEIIAKALSSTLGPDGSTTILQDAQKQHLVTKDGLDVISRMSFQDEVAKTVLDLVKTISLNQVLAVGDGSTSAIIVANALYQEFTSEDNKDFFKYISPKVIIEVLNYISNFLEKELKERAIPLSSDLHELEHIASIAMNNDTEVGKMVRDIYAKIGKFGFVSTDITENYEEDYVEYKKGISWKRGFIDPFFAEKYDGHKIIHNNPKVFITTSPITRDDCELYRQLIGQICNVQQEELVIVANFISDEAKNFFKNAREAYKLGTPEMLFTVVDIDQVTETNINNLKDLALLCGCTVYNKGLHTLEDVIVRLNKNYTYQQHPDKYKFIGNALRATITKNSTEIICDDALLTEDRIEEKNNEIIKLEDELTKLDKKTKLNNEEINYRFTLKMRKANLENLTSIVHVGGKTYQERQSRERLLEDAIFASKSAVTYGYTVGGNIIIPKVLKANKTKLAIELMKSFPYLEQNKKFFEYFIDLVSEGFLESYRSVLENSQILSDNKIDNILHTVMTGDKFYNLKTHKFELFKDTSVINSVDTDIQILKSCISLIGLLATSNQAITLNYDLR